MTNVPYIMFLDGRGAEAIEFYTKTLGFKLVSKMHFKDVKDQPGMEEWATGENGEAIMHSVLELGGAQVMVSDNVMYKGELSPIPNPTSVTLMFNTDSAEEVDKIASLIVENGGMAVMPTGDTFWGARFAYVIDKFNVAWQLHFQKTE